jgi:hypothetical protein
MESSDGVDLHILAGVANSVWGTDTAAAADIGMPESGDLIVFLPLTIDFDPDAPSLTAGEITSDAEPPLFWDEENEILNVTIGTLLEDADKAGVWHWEQSQVGEIQITNQRPNHSIIFDGSRFQLQGDEAEPSANKFFGTGASGGHDDLGYQGLEEITVLVGRRYNSTTHKFQETKRTAYVWAPGSVSAWTDVVDGAQPVSLNSVTALQVDGANYEYEDKKTVGYVLSKDAEDAVWNVWATGTDCTTTTSTTTA